MKYWLRAICVARLARGSENCRGGGGCLGGYVEVFLFFVFIDRGCLVG